MRAQGWFQGKILANNKEQKVDLLLLFLSPLLILSFTGGKIWLHNNTYHMWQNYWKNTALGCHSVCQHCSGFAQCVGYFNGHWPRKRKGMEIPQITQWHIMAEKNPLSISHIPFLPSCLFSFCPKEGHFCPMGYNNIDVKRWVIDWEERTARQLTSGRLLQVPNSIHTCMWHVWRNIHFSMHWYVSIEFCTTCQPDKHVLRKEDDAGAHLLCRPHELCCPATNLYMLGNWWNTALF